MGAAPAAAEDVRALRAIMQPPPPYDMAVRLAVDVAAVHCASHGDPAASPKDRLASYRRFLADANVLPNEESAAALKRDVDRLKQQTNVTLGPCYVPVK